jgi:hypothetical protein
MKNHLSKNIFIVPLYLGDHYKENSHLRNIVTVNTYFRRALLFFQTRKDFSIFYPTDINNAGASYARHFQSNFLENAIMIPMNHYTNSDDNSSSPIDPNITKQLEASLWKEIEKRTQNWIIVVNCHHIPELIKALNATVGFAEETKFDFYSIGGIGDAEAFFFDSEDPESIVHLRFCNYLDFFIPKSLDDLSEDIMRLGREAHKKIQKAGHTQFLKNAANFLL